ncbi:MAG: tetratricopeptide repeat protein [Deltaproteobacteria bacterium]
MRKFIVAIFVLLILLYPCSGKSETASDWYNKAKALNYTDQKKAIGYLNNALRLQPNYADAYNDRGIAYTQLGQNEQAIKDFNEAIRLKPDNVNAYNNRGIVYFNLGQYQRTIEDSNEAIRLKPDNVNAYNNRGASYLKQGNKKLGCRDLQKACALKNCLLFESAKTKGFCR